MAYTGKGIFIAENMVSTDVDAYLRSGIQSTAIENGSIVNLNGLAEGKEEVYKTIALTADGVKTAPLYFVDGVELEYDEQLTRGLHDFENPKDKPFRVRRPVVGDRFSISTNMIASYNASTTTHVKAAAGNKVTSATAGTTTNLSFVAKVIAKWNFGTKAIPMVRLEVTHVV